MAVSTNGDGISHQANETLYCSNLPDKLKKDDLKRALYMLFVSYGPVLDVTALKTGKMRGQAHVLFRDRFASSQALRALQDFEFFGKPMRISFAKSKSHTLAKLDGTYKQPQQESSGEAQGTTTQQSVFAGPPGTSNFPDTNNTSSLGPPPSTAGVPQAPSPADAATPLSQGAKRPREDSDEDDGDDAPMDMDDAPMDESDDD